MSDSQERLNALADGELSPNEEREVRESIASSEELSLHLHSIKSVKDCLSRLDPAPCEESWTRCVKRLDEIDRARRAEHVVGRYGWAMAACLALVILVGGYQSRSRAGVLHSADVPHMVSSLSPFAAFHSSQDPKAGRRWIADYLPSASQMGGGLVPVRGAIGEINGRKVARLVLRDSRGELALIVVGKAAEVDGFQSDSDGFQVGELDGVNCVAWTQRNEALFLVGERDPSELATLARSIVVR